MSVPAPAESSARLARRYGTRPPREDSSPRRTRWGAWVGSAVVAVLLTVVVVLVNVSGEEDVATAQAISYEVVDDHAVSIQLAVTRPDPAVAVTCAVEAVDASLAQVGARVVEVPARPGGARTLTLEVAVTTFARAEQGRAIEGGCFPLEP